MIAGMNALRTYLNGLAPPEQEKFAFRCGTSVGYLRKALSTGQLLREKTCSALERESQGCVTRASLRPLDWHEVWPELVKSEPNQPQAPASNAVAAIENVATGAA